MKFTRCIVALLSLVVLMASCVDESEQLKINTSVEGNAVTICGRITAFDDRLVDTRAGKTTEESYSSSMAMAVFPILEDNESGNKYLADCISYVHLKGSNVNFTVDRSKLRETYGDDYDNKEFALYLFANMPELPATMNELTNKSFDFFMTEAYTKNSGIRRPQKGFPMVGSLGDYVTKGADGNRFVLIPTETVEGNTKIKLPLLNNIPNDYIPIPLKSLYAKFSFAVSVQPDQHIQDGTTPTFTLESYTLNNVPTDVYAEAAKNTDHTSVSGSAITTTVGSSVTEGGSLEFDFYLPERFLTPTTFASSYDYPLGDNGAKIKESAVREEDRPYLQRFKPKLVAEEKKATYITLNGYYLDHQNHNWQVSYDIYLGEDNYSDFNFKRNTNYVNNVVIRGLKASKDQNVTGEGVFVDHRVTITRSLPIIINLHRETLLDAHFEVRPLRIRYPLANGQTLPTGAQVKVEILNEDGTIPNWVRMEHNNGTGSTTTTHLANGKRKYFTTDLVTNTLKKDVNIARTIDLNDKNKNETFWIYVDQCDAEASLSNPNEMREAMVKVTYYENGVSQEPIMTYKLCQHLLYPVKTIRKGTAYDGNDGSTVIYYIEYEEEYLHNFDTEDIYTITDEDGMEWGLNGIQLSNSVSALVLDDSDQGALSGLINAIGGNALSAAYTSTFNAMTDKPYYDFYLSRDVQKFSDFNGKQSDFAGRTFNENIADYLKEKYASHQGENSVGAAKIDGISLGEQPKSAFAYCYNRNKRDNDGKVVSQDWYLPSIDEIEDIMEFAYGDFDVDFQGNMYWSCQPAYELRQLEMPITIWGMSSGTLKGDYFVDNIQRARATRALRENGNFAGVPNSGTPDNVYYGVQKGTMKIPILSTNVQSTMGDYVGNTNINIDFEKDYPGNLPRTSTGNNKAKARVRCVRKAVVVEDN